MEQIDITFPVSHYQGKGIDWTEKEWVFPVGGDDHDHVCKISFKLMSKIIDTGKTIYRLSSFKKWHFHIIKIKGIMPEGKI